MVQPGDGVDDPKHDSSFHPVIHQIGVGQASWSKNGSQTGEKEHGMMHQDFWGYRGPWEHGVYCKKYNIKKTLTAVLDQQIF